MPRRLLALSPLCLFAVLALLPFDPPRPAVAAEPLPDPLAADFTKTVKPLLAKYCAECHGKEKPEGDLDLTAFATHAEVRKAGKVWLKVGDVLDGSQMPPKDAAHQPTADERKALQTWTRAHLKAEAKAHAGDPGRVVLRRLSNAEYTYTIRDLTGVPALDPAKEFPVDGAAGEGFTNTGDALVMSPALLTKYLDAAKGVAAHAVFLPDGIRFSPHTTRRDQTEELIAEIRKLYAKSADGSTGAKVNLQGVVFENKDGGRLPVEKYLTALLEEREALEKRANYDVTPEEVAAKRGLSAKYMAAVWAAVNGKEGSPLLADLRAKWKDASVNDVPALAAFIGGWQAALWKTNPVGHIGRKGGPTGWLTPVDPLTTKQDIRWKVPPTDSPDITFYLATSAAGENAAATWGNPRFVAPGRPDLLLRDVRALAGERTARRTEAFALTAKYLAAADEVAAAKGTADVPALAKKHGLNADVLAGWLGVLGVGAGGPVKVTGHLTGELKDGGGKKAISGWGSNDTPLVLANSSDTPERIPGDARPHGVVVHPSPKLNVAVGWQSPVSGTVKVVAKVQHAHVACGNGVEWFLEVRRGGTRERLASGTAQGGSVPKIDPAEVKVMEGDLISLLVGPRAGDHSCDLTAVDLTLSADGKTWDLGKDVSANILAGNPHSKVWHFYTEPTAGGVAEVIPPGTLLARWRAADAAGRVKLAGEVATWLAGPAGDAKTPDGQLHRKLAALGGPLFGRIKGGEGKGTTYGVDAALFGTEGVNPTDLRVNAPAVLAVSVPGDLIAGGEFVSTVTAGEGGAVQPRVSPTKPADTAGLLPGLPVLASGPAKERMAAGLAAFRDLFPPAVAYTKIVPVDEVVTLTLHYREDDHLKRLMLADAEGKQLDRLWDELHYVSQDAFAQVDAFKQLLEFASQDGDPKLFEPLRKPTMDAAEAFKKRLTDTEPAHLTAVLEFAGRAFRRPLKPAEAEELKGLYAKLGTQGLTHDDAIRLTLARVLVSPAFLYKLEKPGTGATAAGVSDHELATRLSYFLWSSGPDAELRALADAGTLKTPDVLAAQTKRMLADPKVRRMATEFGCQWLHVRGFDALNEKSERHFPEFAKLRAAMYEESVLFFTDLFQHDRPLAHVLDADATYLNEPLAKFYGIPGVSGEQWRRVEGVRKYGRGGILGLSTTLATQSGASRTSPTLRGNWVSEVLLGEKLPKPPKGVPQLPDDEAATDKLTVRQLVEKHASDAKCAVCHVKIDAYGFALEAFDPIGRNREKDLAGRPVDTRAKTADGSEFDGIDGLRQYLLTKRGEAFERQLLKKLLGYSLGRAVALSDEPLLDDMQAAAKKAGRLSAAVQVIVNSRQFRDIRGAKFPGDE